MSFKMSEKFDWENMKKYLPAATVILVAAVLAVVDQVLKGIVMSTMEKGETVPFIKGFMQWTYTTNNGMSWSLLSGQTIFLVTVSVVALGFMAYVLVKGWIQHLIGYCAFAMVAGGAMGNLADRIFNGGHVVDYIDITPWFNFPIFNFADCCIVVGAIILFIYIWIFHRDLDKKDDEPAVTDNAAED